jgi:hypothetical protein
MPHDYTEDQLVEQPAANSATRPTSIGKNVQPYSSMCTKAIRSGTRVFMRRQIDSRMDGALVTDLKTPGVHACAGFQIALNATVSES